MTLLVGCFFVARLDPSGGGLPERLVLRPAVLVLALAGHSLLRARTRADGSNDAHLG